MTTANDSIARPVIKPPVRHDNAWSVVVWRGAKCEFAFTFPTEAKARAALRRSGYPSSKKAVPVSAA